MRIIVYELNEVPWRVIDAFVKAHPRSALAKILDHSVQLTTVTKDEGELHPWTTWPTLHRGVYNMTHDIRFLNQEILTDYAPIWQILAEKGVESGVFGSLQSWPVPEQPAYSFYVPDTFAQDAKTNPESLEIFQKINLSYVEREGGVASKPLKLGLQSIKDGLALVSAGLRISTVFSLAKHLAREYLNPHFGEIRSVYQGPVAFDFYYKLLKEKKPLFSTFFTNQVAGIMHRYWKHAFPEDFGYVLKTKEDRLRSHWVDKAMQVADQQLKDLKKFADEEGYILAIMSSMGQEAVERGEYAGELRITNMDTFYKGIGFDGLVKNNLAMNPDFSFSFLTEEDLQKFQECVAKLGLPDEKKTTAFTFKQAGLTLNCNLQSSAEHVKAGYFWSGAKKIMFKELGISVEKRPQGTGYHQPYGVAIFYRDGLEPNASRVEVESIAIAPTILSLFGLAKKTYMTDPIPQVMESIGVTIHHEAG
jgi:hypothetical protein